jgi:Flp pilus assembly pilin Flp
MADRGSPRCRPVAWVEETRAALRRQEGQTLLEYALIIAFIGMGTIAIMWLLGPAIGEAYQVVTEAITDVSF